MLALLFNDNTANIPIQVDKLFIIGKYHRDPNTKHWWSKDQGTHGGNSWKVFKETPKGLDWIANTDEYGNYIPTNKGPIGKFIPWKKLKILK